MQNLVIETIKKNSLAQGLRFYSLPSACCAHEALQTIGARYDVERFGMTMAPTAAQADVLIVNGLITKALEPHVRQVYDEMLSPKYVLGIGVCACGGGLFSPSAATDKKEDSPHVPLESVVAVDFFIPGCPPRPEAIMYGLLQLQKKIRGEATLNHG